MERMFQHVFEEMPVSLVQLQRDQQNRKLRAKRCYCKADTRGTNKKGRHQINYYEIIRTYFDKNVSIFVQSFLLINPFCDLSVYNIKVSTLGNQFGMSSVSNFASFCISLRIRK